MSFRDGPFNDLKVPLTWTAAVAVVVALIIGIALLLSDRRETLQTHAYGVERRVFDAADRPLADVFATPVRWVRQASDYVGDYFLAISENRRLKQELADLRQVRDQAVALKDANERYRAILGLRTEPPIPMVTGRVVLDTRGPFANSRLADVGEEKAVKVGNPVMSERGLVGRVVGVAKGASRILLLTDVASRTPVLVDRTDARAILMGDGGTNPRLAFLRGQNPVREGDRILTSGDGGVFPRGLPVGVASVGLDGQWRVRLHADLTAIDFIRILEFQDFTALVNEKDLDRRVMPPPPPGAGVSLAAPQPPATAPAADAPTAASAGVKPAAATAAAVAAGAATAAAVKPQAKPAATAKPTRRGARARAAARPRASAAPHRGLFARLFKRGRRR